MSGVDDRIVSMKFDNAAFQQKMAETLNSLDKLKQSLNFSGAANGMSEVSNAAKSFSLSGMSTSIDGISAKFLALATIGVTALSMLARKAIEVGSRLVKAITFGPVIDGFKEFETNMNSIQTILANTQSKGSTLGDVNEALKELNEYSDKTIYNFASMAKNIGTFTAAGVDLQTSVGAIKGIANLAAISGSSADQAATAMYQLSQAIASGSVKLMDWNSVVNAGMGGEVFKKALFETGKALGTIKNVPIGTTFEQWEKSGNNFRDSLSAGNKEVVNTSSKVAAASKESAKAVARAEESAASAVESATERVRDAREGASRAAKDSAKQISDAHKAQSDSAISSAENLKDALDSVTDAQKRLEAALKPASADDLQAATDRLTTSQLDQLATVNDVEEAQREQRRAAQELASAQAVLDGVLSNPNAGAGEREAAQRRLEDAQSRSVDLVGSIERARIRQRDATRSLTSSEVQLNEVKNQGTNADERVVSARDSLAKAQESLGKVRAANSEREVAAAERLAEVVENSSERQASAQKSLADAEKALAKTRKDSQESVAEARESAAKRIAAANEDINGSNQKSWLTSEVLTSTLKGFTGDLTEAQIMQMGYTKEQAQEIMRLGKLGVESATKVKTFTQLMATLKEALGTGWADSFKLIFGGFDEARDTFTGINTFLGGFITRSAEARNSLLQGWRDLDGRTILVQGFKDAIAGIGSVLKPIKDAFRQVFPAKTAEDLVRMTQSFANFTKGLKIGAETSDNLKRTFAGFFSILSIGWTVVKEVFKLIVGLVTGLSGPAAGGLLSFTAKVGDMQLALQRALVAGGGIERFFGRVKAFLAPVVGLFANVADGVSKFFNGMEKAAPAEAALGRLEDRFGGVVDVVEKIKGFKTTVPQILKDIGDAINKWFSELGAKMAASSKPGDFDAAIDILNVALLGGIALLIKKAIKLMKGGLDFDFGTGIIANIKGAFGELTDTLNLMQAKLKADILTKIAIAIGVLTASVLILSMIDSANLAKALAAIAVGFAELMGAMTVLTTMSSGPKGAAKVTLLVSAMIALSGAMVILAGAIKILSTIDPGDMATALAGLAGALTIMITAMNFMSTNPAGLISGGIAMTAMAVALMLLSVAIKEFAEISWSEMLKGMVGIAASLAILVIAMNAMSINAAGWIAGGIAMVAIAVALRILAEAVEAFAEMSWGEMLQGLAGITLSLLGIAFAMTKMPPGMALTSLGLLQVALSLSVIAKVVETLGEMKFGDLLKGLAGLAAMMTILAISLKAMTGTAAGAAALLVAAGAILVLTGVLKVLGSMSIAEIITGLAALAAVLAVIGIASKLLLPVIPAMLALGVAMAVLGAAMALFGAGAWMIARAFEVMARAGVVGMKAMVEAMKIFITFLPELVKALARSLIELAAELLRAAPMLLKLFTILLVQILDSIIEVAPKIAEAFAAIIEAAVMLLRTKFPLLITAAFEMLMTFLKAIRDNVGEITSLAVDILINFVDTLTNNAFRLVAAGINFLMAFLGAIRDRIGEVVTAAFDILMAFIRAVGENLWRVINLGGEIIKVLVTEIGRKAGEIATAATNTVIKFVEELGRNLHRVTTAAVDVALAFIKGITDNTQRFINSAAQLLIDFLNGLAYTIRERSQDLRNAGANIASAIVEGLVGGLNAGDNGPIGAVVGLAGKVVGAFMNKINASSPSKLFMKIGGYITKGLAMGLDRGTHAENSAVASAERIISAFQTTLNQIPDSLEGMAELSPVITPILDLTRVQAESRNLSRLIPSSMISAGVSFGQADQIARTSELDTTSGESATDGFDGPREVKFEQNIYSPTALSTGEIYRNTKSQIALAKEELSIP